MTSQIFKNFKEHTSQFQKNQGTVQFKDRFFKERETSQNSKIHKEHLLQSSKLGNLLTFVAWKLSIKHHLIFFFLFYQRCVLKTFLEKTIFWLAHFLAVYDKEQLVFFFKKLRNKFKEWQYILKKHKLVQIFMRSL